MSFRRIFIGLGSNLQDPGNQVIAAFAEVDALAGISLVRRSSLYRSAPLGYADQPDFINAVGEIRTQMSPYELLAELQGIERQHGRRREFKNSPRTLDLDILLYGDLQLTSAALTLPHPGAHQRAFVLLPLHEIAPETVIPGIGPISDWLPNCAGQQVTRIPDPTSAIPQEA